MYSVQTYKLPTTRSLYAYVALAMVIYVAAFAPTTGWTYVAVAEVYVFALPTGVAVAVFVYYTYKVRGLSLLDLPNLPVRYSDLKELPRSLIAGIVIAIMGMVSIIIGTVLFGSTAGIGAYIDNVFRGMGVQSNITETIKSFNFPVIFNLFGIALLIVGFVVIILGLLGVGKHAQTLWRSD